MRQCGELAAPSTRVSEVVMVTSCAAQRTRLCMRLKFVIVQLSWQCIYRCMVALCCASVLSDRIYIPSFHSGLEGVGLVISNAVIVSVEFIFSDTWEVLADVHQHPLGLLGSPQIAARNGISHGQYLGTFAWRHAMTLHFCLPLRQNWA